MANSCLVKRHTCSLLLANSRPLQTDKKLEKLIKTNQEVKAKQSH